MTWERQQRHGSFYRPICHPPSLPPSRFLACTALAAQRNRVYGLEAATAHFIINTPLHHTSRSPWLLSSKSGRKEGPPRLPRHTTERLRFVSFHFASFKPVRLRADFRSKKIWKIAREEYRTRKKKRIDVADIINANHFSKACLIFKPR